jgi:hypothetical protein
MIPAGAGWLPIDVAPVGLVTWFAPGGPAAALLTSWLAVVGGTPPQLRAGCGGCGLHEGQFPAGTDFAVNVPAERQFPKLQALIRDLRAGAPLMAVELAGLIPARMVSAPLLAGCALHLECARGSLMPGDWERELAGELLLLRRGAVTHTSAAGDDFCALWPLRASLPG